ncbi:hypothetical protein BIY37_05530 [Candidatus Brocadia sapporoensis]|uniref:Uncharacterized protein n=1 Tax=Candidatus Brocadia sapporoensis TaxID=392547 RepID=A0A1V6M0V8_9BACT|nr:hypothetical protein BIY37_05530 [Candidatus Brocadia sapporoensis]TVL94957.1 MAG: hypothetical protein CV082_12845 [Candidatus Brocadia sp. BL1]
MAIIIKNKMQTNGSLDTGCYYFKMFIFKIVTSYGKRSLTVSEHHVKLLFYVTFFWPVSIV